jgi:hypothetical protein
MMPERKSEQDLPLAPQRLVWHWIAGLAPTRTTSWVYSFLFIVSQFPNTVLMIAITSHYIDDNFELHEDLLDFQEVSVSHTGVNLANHVFEILIKYNIHTRLYCITTDNASNNGTMVTALSHRLAEKGIQWDAERHHIACLAHVINLAVKEFLSTLKIQSRTPEDEWEVLDFQARQTSSTDPHQKYKIKGNNPFDRAIQKIRKVSSLINYPPSHLKNFEKACDLMKVKFMRAVKDVDTRWNSTYSMLARAVLLKEAINGWTRMKSDYVNLILRDDEWIYVEFLVHFLAPFYRTTQLLQSTNVPTLQRTFETYEGLFNALDNVKGLFQNMSVRSEWIKDVETGVTQMWNKLQHYYSKGKPFAYCDAIILHPTEKNRWFRRRNWDMDLVESYRMSIRDRLERNYGDSEPGTRKRDYSALISDDSDSDSDASETEFDTYMKYKKQHIKDPLEWWKQSQGMFPKLAQMARDTYAVPATGSGVEREFSISGNIVNNRRNRLSPTTISNLMQFKRWLSRTGVLAKYLKDNQVELAMETDNESDVENEDDEEELNQELIDWLTNWEKAMCLEDRARALVPVA